MNTPLMFLTAAEVMSRNVILVPQDMSLKGGRPLAITCPRQWRTRCG